jgi:hypothetical protein
MEAYNIHDVRILEETYLMLRPWIKPHPNMALFISTRWSDARPVAAKTWYSREHIAPMPTISKPADANKLVPSGGEGSLKETSSGNGT